MSCVPKSVFISLAWNSVMYFHTFHKMYPSFFSLLCPVFSTVHFTLGVLNFMAGVYHPRICPHTSLLICVYSNQKSHHTVSVTPMSYLLCCFYLSRLVYSSRLCISVKTDGIVFLLPAKFSSWVTHLVISNMMVYIIATFMVFIWSFNPYLQFKNCFKKSNTHVLVKIARGNIITI